MRKREKRTGTRHGLGNLLRLEIDDRAHDVRPAIAKNTRRNWCVRLVRVQVREGEWGCGGKGSE